MHPAPKQGFLLCQSFNSQRFLTERWPAVTSLKRHLVNCPKAASDQAIRLSDQQTLGMGSRILGTKILTGQHVKKANWIILTWRPQSCSADQHLLLTSGHLPNNQLPQSMDAYCAACAPEPIRAFIKLNTVPWNDSPSPVGLRRALRSLQICTARSALTEIAPAQTLYRQAAREGLVTYEVTRALPSGPTNAASIAFTGFGRYVQGENLLRWFYLSEFLAGTQPGHSLWKGRRVRENTIAETTSQEVIVRHPKDFPEGSTTTHAALRK